MTFVNSILTYSKKHFVLVVAYLYVLLFVYAAVSKVLDFETFTLQLAQSPLLSAYAGIISWLVPGVEILISIFLMIPRYRRVALYASFFLMVMFTTYIVIILNFSDFIPCSCGGVLEKLGWTEHLIFNIVFIVLAALAILFTKPRFTKRKLLALVILVVVGIGVVALLFAFSEKKMHRNNAFQRRYMPHPIENVGEFDLESDTYYIAGMDGSSIYLGDYRAPLYLTRFDLSLKKFEKSTITISNTELPYRRVRIVVRGPYFYLVDGTVPIIFRGRLEDKLATMYYDQAYFTQFVLTDSANLGLVTTSSETGNTILALVLKTDVKDSLIFNHRILTEQMDGVFDSDGSLLWNSNHRQFIYVYRYRNSFEVSDFNLSHLYSGKTIDTISQAIIDLEYYERKEQYRLGANTVVVNKASTTCGDYLFIESDRLGKYDDGDLRRTSSIIDVYNLREDSYEFSFYLYHEPNEALKEFRVFGDRLVAIIGETLQIYKLKPEYFNSGSNTTHTAQYQD
ncbi:MauE/DoxX family redox-associated membrane protein [Aequorivita viscosa]|uniref:Uncharacterized membrane protein YphA, DoxX/SURF4 family n=1 Tax=Aequorivita viscosa TaxID=797419 RepID=A0A1M6MHV5_9FLAO|nr:MauE/DoxX family redox-associated membrane protein [Aequorivita viscosa]SDX33842.1 Uncharacterized membrane protein YphA, DoxX/SURF4 family [Aequorivita viscosa]SHJ82890.1 Uncharacterized membrane protein YphA, DoxX/SURF4 family [Aequorivita viscosa]